MDWFRSIWGIGLCLGLAGCASTQQRVVLGPGHAAGARTAAAHSSCGCGAVQSPMLTSANPSPVVATLAPRPPLPSPIPSARFFPLLHEQDGAPVDPLENPRVDLLGVRTVKGNAERVAPILRDSAMKKASTEEPLPPVLPLVLKIAARHDVPEVVSAAFDAPSTPQDQESPQGGMPMAVEEPASIEPADADAEAAAAVPTPRERGETVALEYADDSLLAGRPRLSNDGSVDPGPRSNGEPTGSGPDPAYPAAYYAGGSAPTTVPKNREVWPVWRPWRPTVLPRVWQRIRETVASGSAMPAFSAVRETRNVAERGQ